MNPLHHQNQHSSIEEQNIKHYKPANKQNTPKTQDIKFLMMNNRSVFCHHLPPIQN
jgi:hypothetical protein